MNTDNATTMPETHSCAGAANPVSRLQSPLNRREFLARASVLGVGLLSISREIDAEPAPEHATEGARDRRYTWCFNLEILGGLEIYLIGYEGRDEEDGDSWNRFLTDSDRRLLYCTDLERISDMLAKGGPCAGRLPDLSLEEIHWASIPYALDDLREGRDLSSSAELFYGIDALTDIVPSCGYTWNEGLCGFLMGCWSHLFERSSASWDDVRSSGGYKELTVEEGIQLAVGIVLSSARRIAEGANPCPAGEVESEEVSCESTVGTTRLEDVAEISNRPTCYCLEISRGHELYFLCYQSCDEVTWAPVLTDSERRLLFCSDVEVIPRMLQLGRADLARFGQPDLEVMEYVSIPVALNEYHMGVPMGQCWELFAVFDIMTNLLPSAGYSYHDGINEFLLGCFMNLFGSPRLPWEKVVLERGYKGLSVEEGIQLVLGIVLTQGRYVA